MWSRRPVSAQLSVSYQNISRCSGLEVDSTLYSAYGFDSSSSRPNVCAGDCLNQSKDNAIYNRWEVLQYNSMMLQVANDHAFFKYFGRQK